MVQERTNVLIYAVRGRIVAKYSGQLAVVLALLTTVPLGFALVEREWALALRYVVLGGALLAVGGLLGRLPAPERIQANEALTVTALAFLCASLLMAWPMMEAGVSFLDALFEAVSGVTTTGLSVVGNIEQRSTVFLFARSWMQWYGGLGFVVLSLALLIGHQAAARRLVGQVKSNETLMVTAHTHARRMFSVYLFLTLAGLALVWILTGDAFTAVLHVLSAVSTGGFSSHDASLAGLRSRPAAAAIMTISFLSAISLYLYWRAFYAGWRDGLRTLLTDVELRALLLACLLAGGALSLLAGLGGGGSPWYHGFMMGISAQTTTGFSTMPVADLDPASKLVMILSMLVGGSVGSSAGGVKLLRFLILLRLLQLMLRRTGMPSHAVAEPYLGEQRLEADDLSRAMQVILLFIFIIVLSWFPFLVMGYDPLDSLFEVVSACGTVGLSSGISRPELEAFLKGVLCFDMLAGRVEIVAILVILYPHNWLGRREKTQ